MHTAASGSPVSMMCRQISDFDVSRIRFCPWDETTLVSGGRENIRFWRIRKGHLPGRPVLLNEYSRGYSFKDVAFYAHHGMSFFSVIFFPLLFFKFFCFFNVAELGMCVIMFQKKIPSVAERAAMIELVSASEAQKY